MIKTLYKGSHFLASVILGMVLLACLALIDIPQANATLPVAGASAQPDMLGRFVVGPKSSVFVPATTAGE